MRKVEPDTLQAWIHDAEEVALFDVREQGQYGSSHPFFAVPLAYSRLEIDVVRLAPRAGVRIVLVDDGDGLAQKAAVRLEELGYGRVFVLDGGVRAWEAAGFPLFAGVHVPSKAFGELAEHAYRTPAVSATALAKMIEAGEDVIVLDGRPFSEYQKMNIPGALCCPNGELGFRIHRLIGNDETRVVINCAGRTRSIIGAQTLINLGLKNPVFALENGTQGWALAGLELEHGSQRKYPPVAGPADASGAPHPMLAASMALSDRFGVPEADATTVKGWLEDPTRTTFLFDVRTSEEFKAGTIPGARHAPGGQLLQGTDLYIGVRGARIVVFDNDGVRAPTIASWLLQMGHEAWVLKDWNTTPWPRVSPVDPMRSMPSLPSVALSEFLAMRAQGQVAVVDLRASSEYRRGHIPGSVWSIRPRLAVCMAEVTGPIVFVADDERISRLALVDLPPAQRDSVATLQGGFGAWRAAGHPIVVTPDLPPDGDCIDFLFFVHDRHAGNLEAARQYLAWEIGLVERLHPQDRATFRLPASADTRT